MMGKATRAFGICGAVGAVALVVHVIVFFTAEHYGAAVPAGNQTYGIVDHGHVTYVSPGVQLTIQVLEIIMLAGLGIGVPGILAVEFWSRKRAREARP
jgi:hypothetical protein